MFIRDKSGRITRWIDGEIWISRSIFLDSEIGRLEEEREVILGMIRRRGLIYLASTWLEEELASRDIPESDREVLQKALSFSKDYLETDVADEAGGLSKELGEIVMQLSDFLSSRRFVIHRIQDDWRHEWRDVAEHFGRMILHKKSTWFSFQSLCEALSKIKGRINPEDGENLEYSRQGRSILEFLNSGRAIFYLD